MLNFVFVRSFVSFYGPMWRKKITKWKTYTRKSKHMDTFFMSPFTEYLCDFYVRISIVTC